jgi:hypothetical protein
LPLLLSVDAALLLGQQWEERDWMCGAERGESVVTECRLLWEHSLNKIGLSLGARVNGGSLTAVASVGGRMGKTANAQPRDTCISREDHRLPHLQATKKQKTITDIFSIIPFETSNNNLIFKRQCRCDSMKVVYH